ncbi:alpha/beta-type small acid-soluble spore protein [Metabacillus bambusae]|uniref:Alpha/beta-type small acid-soluble spore protein n=1 Tax=Metabacillus bambusae TaxID=2795218 RepID=A0ABS3N2P2_9BACI|nr:alpha/beta-type small acid-soluble spore protein [Metabacillus bambusae]MBO1512535.1 alpha/beta-type small acid-soluble spore protein [Metabacillus bambusae]
MANRNKILVPNAKQGVNQLKAKVANTKTPDEAKYEIAKELGVPLKKGYNGSLTSRQAGKIGGNLGGNMVREMVKMAEQQLKK